MTELNESELELLAHRWIAENQATKDASVHIEPTSDSAIYVFMDLVEEDARIAWKLMKRVCQLSNDEWVLENLGAGNFETLLHQVESTLLEFFEPQDFGTVRKLLQWTWIGSLSIEKRRDIETIVNSKL